LSWRAVVNLDTGRRSARAHTDTARPLAQVILIYLVIGITFIPVGSKCLVTSRSVVEVSSRYDNLPACVSAYAAAAANPQGATPVCTVTLGPFPKSASTPLFVYYELGNMFMNHRRMVVSRSDAQLRGEPTTELDNKLCGPQEYFQGNSSALINPCGLAAWAYFNDTFTLSRTATSSLLNDTFTLSTTGLAYAPDKKTRFKAVTPSSYFNIVPSLRGGGQLVNNGSGGVNSDERFIAWMRPPALPTFRKLYGRIDSLTGSGLAGTSIQQGETITVQVANVYNTYSFSGQKRIVISTSTWLGGANDFLGIAYIVVGCVCLALAAFFAMLGALKKRAPGDPRFLSWNKAAAANAAVAAGGASVEMSDMGRAFSGSS
jgi:hypothetical protein